MELAVLGIAGGTQRQFSGFILIISVEIMNLFNQGRQLLV